MSATTRLRWAMFATAFLVLHPISDKGFAQNSHLESIIKAYKDEKGVAPNSPTSQNGTLRNPSGMEPYQNNGVAPNSYPSQNYRPSPQSPQLDRQPQTPPSLNLIRDPYRRPDDIIYQQPPKDIPRIASSRQPGPISSPPQTVGGNPKDPLNVRYTQEPYFFDTRKTKTPYDEMINDSRLNDVFFVNASRGWAVGDRGGIWMTADGGKTWTMQESPICCTLRSVHFLTESYGIAAGGFVYPFTSQGQGVVLQTQDGGNRWTIVPTPHFPVIHHIRLLDSMKGIAAGESSPLHPSGLFQTNDGGRTWKPIPGGKGEGWNCVDFFDDKNGFGISSLGTVQIYRNGTKLSQVPALGSTGMNGIKMVANPVSPDTVNGWMVGDGGLILSTSDRGLRWGVAPGKLPGNSATTVDLNSVESLGANLWVGGNPGSFIYCSKDQGKTWKAAPTGVRATIRKIVFADEKTGWAVGDLGTILRTENGGETWTVSRSGGSKLSMLGLFGRAEDIPLEAFVRLCAGQGYLGGAVLLFRDDSRKSETFESPWLDRVHEAMLRTGGCGVWETGNLTLERKETLLSAENIIRRLDKEHDGKGLQRLRERIVAAIRQWRPEIVFTSGSGGGKDPVKELVLREVVEAVKLANDPTAFPYQLTELNLLPWKVKKIHLTLEQGVYGDVNLQTMETIPRLGQAIDELAFPARGMIRTHWEGTSSVLGFATSRDECPPAGNRDFFAGIDIAPGSDARRALNGSYESFWEANNARTMQRRNALGIINNLSKVTKENGEPMSRARLAASASDLTRKIDHDAAVQILLEMGRRFSLLGDWGSALESYEIIAMQHAGHPFARNAYAWLLQYYTGEEVVATEALELGTIVRRGIATGKERSEVTAKTPNEAMLMQNAEKATALTKFLEQNYPGLAEDPKFRFGLVSVLRNQGWTNEAVRYLQRRGELSNDDVWGMRARAEYWLTQRDRAGVPEEQKESPLPTIFCAFTPTKPFLDGRFDKEFDQGTWFNSKLYSLTPAKPRKRLEELYKNELPSGKPVGLLREERSLAESMNLGSNVMFMYDDQYLYIGVRCKKSAGFSYPPIAEKPRTRDAEIDDQDRIEILIDTNRDYATYYKLTVDSRGWAGDECWGDKSWDPNMYIARHEDDDHWYIEAVISFESMATRFPAAKTVWGVAVRRIVPGVGIECWNAENSFNLTEAFGFLVFN